MSVWLAKIGKKFDTTKRFSTFIGYSETAIIIFRYFLMENAYGVESFLYLCRKIKKRYETI